MNENIRKWMDALRSGQYAKGQDYLRSCGCHRVPAETKDYFSPKSFNEKETFPLYEGLLGISIVNQIVLDGRSKT